MIYGQRSFKLIPPIINSVAPDTNPMIIPVKNAMQATIHKLLIFLFNNEQKIESDPKTKK